MLPMRDSRWQTDDQPDLNVLVPGLMGIGFLISLVMLVADGFTKVVPLAGRRRTAALVRLSRGRVSDTGSIWNGVPPVAGAVLRVPRRRVVAALIALALFAVSAVAIAIGIDIADTVGTDRQAWAVISAILIAAAATFPGVVWLLAAVTGPAAPRWLLWLQQFWPFGVLPKLSEE